jgi:hypothetical protein
VKERYLEPARWAPHKIKLVRICDAIVNEYASKGFRLTVRQIYYQLVAKNHVPNNKQSYNNVQSLLNDARLYGYIDWDAIEDRTRDVIQRSHWSCGGDILNSAAKAYHEDMWQDQDHRVFVVIEKDALAGVFEPICNEFDMPLLPARGYPSASTLREFAKGRIMRASQQIVVLHLGDHDPSGIDMSRDLIERLMMFSRGRKHIDFRRLALNMDQIEEQKPPPNPVKMTDSRVNGYMEEFGTDESWELDALTPEYLDELVRNEVTQFIDTDRWEKRQAHIEGVRERLQKLAQDFDKGQNE